MTLFENFGAPPGQNPHKYFHNLVKEFKKTLASSKDPSLLEIEMEKLINASKQMKWKEGKKEYWKKGEGEKILDKIWKEFSRYVNHLRTGESRNNLVELQNALTEVESLVQHWSVL